MAENRSKVEPSLIRLSEDEEVNYGEDERVPDHLAALISEEEKEEDQVEHADHIRTKV